MAVIKNMMVRAGADFSAFTTQSKKATKAVKGMETGVTRSFNNIKKAASSVGKVLGALGVAVSAYALISAAKDAAEAYDKQAEAEIKLATVMRNTMNARNSEIQSILDLCTAQQKLGVIGDEAQIAGAQELATYLSMTDSLKTLIPVMNDMAAQQYGFNVTAEQCTSIATMLGKVMEGQTGALRRYGYYFTEAEESILKYGTEAEKAAMLSKIITQNVGGMNHALAQTPSGRMRQLANALGDIKEQFGQCIRAIGVLLLPLLWKVAEVLQVIANWANRAVNSIAKVFGYASLLTGWQDIGTGVAGLGDDWDDLTGAITGTGEAAAEAKRKMLGFDELNVLGGNGADSGGSGGSGSGGSGGGSGSGTGTGGTGGLLGSLQDMIGAGDDGDIPWLTKALTFVKDHLELIKGLALGVGSALLTWKLLNGTDLGFKSILGWIMTIAGAVTAVHGGLNAWKDGVNWDNLIEMLGGTTVATLGLALAFGKTGAAIGLLVGGVGMLVVGIKDWITTGTLSTQTFYLMEGGIAALGVGLALLTGSWIPLVVAAVAAAALAIYNYWDEICAWVSGAWEAVSAWFTGVWESVTAWLSEAWQWVCDGFTAFLETVGGIWAAIRQGAIDTFVSVRDWIVNTATSAWTRLSNTWANIRARTTETFNNIRATVQANISAARQHISVNMAAARANAVAAWNGLKASCVSIFSQVKSTIITMISQATAHLMSVSWVSIGVSLMQGFLNGLRSLMSTIWNEVVSFVQSVTNAVCGVLGIHSPSTVFAEIGEQLDAGLIVGLRSGMPDVMSEMGDMTAALESSINPQIASPDGLASGYMTQGGSAETGSDSETMEGILAYVMQMYEWLQTEGGRPYVGTIDGDVLFEAMVERNNRAIRRTGASPIRT